MNMIYFGIRMAGARNEQRITQKELAQMCGVTETRIQQLERGHARGIRLDTAVLIADALHMSLDVLAGRADRAYIHEGYGSDMEGYPI